MVSYVAPHVGAWIETLDFSVKDMRIASHPMWVRGLKLIKLHLLTSNLQSHPMWVRGLKHPDSFYGHAEYKVAPHVGAWIETN